LGQQANQTANIHIVITQPSLGGRTECCTSSVSLSVPLILFKIAKLLKCKI